MENCEKCGKDGASKVTYWTDGGGTVYDEGAYEPNPVQIEEMLCADCDEKRKRGKRREGALFVALVLLLLFIFIGTFYF